MVARLDFSRSF